MTFWRLMGYAFYVFGGLVIVFLVLPKVLGLISRVLRKLRYAIGVILLLAAIGATYEAIESSREEREPPPGRLVDVGGHKMHLHCTGQGTPTVILESGLWDDSIVWHSVQPEIAKLTRVCSYDRAGLGYSDPRPDQVPDSRNIARNLHALLANAGVNPPYILVGHSFGGLTMPLFAARYPEQTAGVVLVDPVVPVEWNPPSEHDRRLTEIGAKVCRRAAFLARIGLIRFVAFLLTTGAKGPAGRLVRLISRGTPAESGSVSSPWFWALPANERKMASVFWIQEKFAISIASQLENLPVNAARVNALGNYCDKPVVILSARTSPQRRREEHAATARRLPRGIHVLAQRSSHWIMWEEPELVIRAIQTVADSFEGTIAASGSAASGSSGLAKSVKDASQVLRD